MPAVLSSYYRVWVLLVFCFVCKFNTPETLAQPSNSISVFPQPVFINYTADSGLPSSEVFHAFQDSVGYMWFATSNGVSRYDGYSFENFDMEDGLVENTIHEIYSDYQGRIWFISGTGKLVYFQNGKFTAYPYNDKLQKLLPANRGTVKNSFYVDRSGNVHISFKRFGRFKISTQGVLNKITGFFNEGDIAVERLINGKVLLASNTKPSQKIVTYSDGIHRYTWNYNRELHWKHFESFHQFAVFLPDSSLLVNFLPQIIHLKDGKLINRYQFETDIIWLSIDNENNIWVSETGGGIYCFTEANLNQKPKLHALRDVQVTSVVTDSEGGVWFTTLNNGIYFCANLNAKTYFSNNSNFENLRLSSLFAHNDKIFLGYDNGLVGVLEKNIISFSKPAKNIFAHSSIRDITLFNRDRGILVASSTALHKMNGGEIKHFVYTLNNSRSLHPRQIIPSQKGDYILASAYGIKRFDGEKITYDSYTLNEFAARVFSVYEKQNGNILLGCSNGLWEYDGTSYSFLGENEPLLSKQIVSIAAFNDNKIFVGTKGLGLVVLNSNGSVEQITKKEGLASNSVNHVHLYNNQVWLATSEGANRISFNTDGSYQILRFDRSKGLPTDDVLRIHNSKSNLLFGTRKGLTIINESDVPINSSKPKSHIKFIKANNAYIDIPADSIISLNYDQNLVEIGFVGFSYLNQGNMAYKYQMLGLDSLWHVTTNTNALFTNLPGRSYTFRVKTQNNDGIWGPTQKVFIKIEKPYWQTTLFLIIVTITFSVILFAIYRIRIQSIRKRNELINTTNLYKMQALRQQMNPHFIFNTLNSIQLFILENDPLNSHKYLTKFARLIRMSLDNSQEPRVRVAEEIEALRLYLDLESLRLEGKFTYNINIAEPEILNLKIPPFLIQPFVENSIWHGIMLKQTKTGHVEITLEIKNNHIICQIEDNGIGRKAANSINEKSERPHKSLGYKITSQRVELLNSIYRNSFNIQYVDLTGQNGSPSGTRVIIQIPV